ncbi:hypothetical protein ACFW04_014440 [Cataglyphis niger]
MFISWYVYIVYTKNIKIKKNNRICELHFKSEDIIKEDAFLQNDGTVIYKKIDLLCKKKKQLNFLLEISISIKNIDPTSYWFANINDYISCMIWTCWANDLSYILRLFIGDKEISFDTKIINNIQEMKQILMKLQILFPCEKINDEDRITNCHGFVIKRQYIVEEKMRCLACKNSWKRLLKKKHNLTLMQKLRNNNKKLKISN